MAISAYGITSWSFIEREYSAHLRQYMAFAMQPMRLPSMPSGLVLWLNKYGKNSFVYSLQSILVAYFMGINDVGSVTF